MALLPDNGAPPAGRLLANDDQTASDADQTASDADQTASDADRRPRRAISWRLMPTRRLPTTWLAPARMAGHASKRPECSA